ncbi:MAG TPA: hypothetical protein VJ804_07300 [Acidimicrobiales bacterium]|nr:hypothetical protein [Acidimicrobiales bacterium]
MPVHHRRSIVLGALSLLVALGATVAAMYEHDPGIGLRTGRAPQEVELHLSPGPPPVTPEEPSTTTAPRGTPPTVPVTSPTTAPPISVPVTGGVYGVVVDQDGNPVIGVCVGTADPTDPTGRFAVAGLAPGPYVVDVATAGGPGCFPLAVAVDRPVVTVEAGRWIGPAVLVVDVGDALGVQ